MRNLPHRRDLISSEEINADLDMAKVLIWRRF
jgi:hypothetical protein